MISFDLNANIYSFKISCEPLSQDYGSIIFCLFSKYEGRAYVPFLFMNAMNICWSVRWGTDGGNDSGKWYGTVATSFCGGMKGACRHVSTSTPNSVLELRKECVKSVGKLNYILGVKLTHPYIGVCENNCLCDMRLKDTCTVSNAWRRALVE